MGWRREPEHTMWAILQMRGKLVILFAVLIIFYRKFTRKWKSLQNKVVLITGGGQGIGALMAERFAQEGCKKVIDEKLGGYPSAHGHCVFKCDVSKRETV